MILCYIKDHLSNINNQLCVLYVVTKPYSLFDFLNCPYVISTFIFLHRSSTYFKIRSPLLTKQSDLIIMSKELFSQLASFCEWFLYPNYSVTLSERIIITASIVPQWIHTVFYEGHHSYTSWSLCRSRHRRPELMLTLRPWRPQSTIIGLSPVPCVAVWGFGT